MMHCSGKHETSAIREDMEISSSLTLRTHGFASQGSCWLRVVPLGLVQSARTAVADAGVSGYVQLAAAVTGAGATAEARRPPLGLRT